LIFYAISYVFLYTFYITMSTPSSASTIVNTAVSAANPNVRTWTQLNDGNNSLWQMQPLEWNVSQNPHPLIRSEAEPVIHMTAPNHWKVNKAA
jgi:hypothetical protein